MEEILKLLVRRCSFFWARGYVISKTGYGVDFSSAYVDLEPRSKALKLEFLCEHGQIYLDLYGNHRSFGSDRHPIDILRTMVTGAPYLGDVVSDEHLSFLEGSIDTIEAMFADDANAAELNRKVGDHIKLRLKARRGQLST